VEVVTAPIALFDLKNVGLCNRYYTPDFSQWYVRTL